MAEDEVFTLKLLVNKATNKVLFAEAPKEVVDFLFGLFETPLVSVIKVLTSEHMVGSFGNLFHSVAALDATYLKSTHVRDDLLDPVVRLLLSPAARPAGSGAETKYYRCSNNYNNCRCRSDYFSDVYGVACPNCNYQMTRQLTLVCACGIVAGKQSGDQTEGYVKEVVTYTIKDDLTVTPMSTTSVITILNKYNVMGVGVLEERAVKLGFDHVLELGLKLLQASLQSQTVLSDVFLAPDVEAAE